MTSSRLTPPTVHEMAATDVDSVIEIGTATPEFRTGTEAAQFFSRDTLIRWLQEPTGVALVVKETHRVVGFILAQYMPASRDGYLNTLAVLSEHRSKGYGGILLESAFTKLEEMGCNHVFGSVQVENEKMVGFLKRHGIEVGDSFNYVETMLPRSRDVK